MVVILDMDKVQRNSLTKTKMDLNNRKMTNRPASPSYHCIVQLQNT